MNRGKLKLGAQRAPEEKAPEVEAEADFETKSEHDTVKSSIDEPKPGPDVKPPLPAPPPPLQGAAAKPKVYRVVKGKSCTSLIGIIDEGTPVLAKHFNGGQVTLDRLVEVGTVEIRK